MWSPPWLTSGDNYVYPDRIATIGYCFGDIAAINLAIVCHDSDHTFPSLPTSVLYAVTFHAANKYMDATDATFPSADVTRSQL